MTVTTNREERAQRREAAKQQPSVTTLETDDGGLVTLETDMIRQPTGHTPTAAAGRLSVDGPDIQVLASESDGGPGSGHEMTSGTRGTTGNDDMEASTDNSASAVRIPRRGDRNGLGGYGFGRTPPEAPATAAERTSGTGDGALYRQVVVREKAKALKLTKFKGLDDAMPVTMWLKTVRSEVRRQAATMGVQWSDNQLRPSSRQERSTRKDARRRHKERQDGESTEEEKRSCYAGLRTGDGAMQSRNDERMERTKSKLQIGGGAEKNTKGAAALKTKPVDDDRRPHKRVRWHDVVAGRTIDQVMTGVDTQRVMDVDDSWEHGTPQCVQAALVLEIQKINKEAAETLFAKAKNLALDSAVREDEARRELLQRRTHTRGPIALESEDTTSLATSYPPTKVKLELPRSRARRRQEKRVRKARAKERRDIAAALSRATHPEDAYFESEKQNRRNPTDSKSVSRRVAIMSGNRLSAATTNLRSNHRTRVKWKRYEYHSSSVYSHMSTKTIDGGLRPMRVGQLRAVQAPTVDSLPTATVEVGGHKRQVKIDTGAQYSVAGEAWKSLGEGLDTLPPVDYVEGFTGVVAKVVGVWRFRLRTQYDQVMMVDALVIAGVTGEFLLGEDWMLSNGVKIDFTSCEMKWYTDDTKKIVPFSCAIANSEAKEPHERVELAVAAPEGTVDLFMPAQRVEPHLMLAPTLTTVRNGKVVVPVMNLVGSKAKLPAREILGTWSPTAEDMQILDMTGELSSDKVAHWVNEMIGTKEPLRNEHELDIGDMSDSDRELILTLLRRYPTLLEPRDGCPPMTTLGVEHEIHTGNEAPIKVRPRRHAQEEHRIIDDNVDEMLHDGVVEEGNGSWGFPVVLVKKKDGSVRFCIDYRRLNAITKRDVYSLPRIDDTLDHLHGARRYTSLDMHSGYWQVPVAAKDRDKTGFVTRKGLFRFVRMPFGLANAPGTFQRMMGAGLTWQTCLVYLDDVIVFTKGSVARHVVELAMVLERLSQAGLSLKAKKCTFAAERLEYLGHELDRNGVRPMRSLVQSVENFPEPTDVVAVKRFVHMARYYRRFVPKFASRAAPLTKLLRKGVEWRWGVEQQTAFQELKETLTRRPVLVYPDFTKPFRLVIVASQVGLGATLTQGQGSGEQPIAYASKTNSDTVAKYSITDLEHDNRSQGATGGSGTTGANDVAQGQNANGGQGNAEVEILRGRGRPRLQVPMPALLQVATAGYIVVRGRRRARNRAGRYVREHEVDQRGRPTNRRWLTEKRFEALDDAGKIADDLEAGDGV
ncbi:LOW QUALITY PROTEIN: Hypothetical protein PHPALM_4615 [Phytophthora palmivora]|uniref:Reverse transcriptase domain-containing protein n=1 Tax=Phytophthora palmivora TaxID=4796 RepID=A0A2P4YJF6_9STRA|nr:LOW QUALITY PROTEIN: Hypothetical protein PHPALM_4615 [Phytophthora palmivora]